jgi:hypothetical protein
MFYQKLYLAIRARFRGKLLWFWSQTFSSVGSMWLCTSHFSDYFHAATEGLQPTSTVYVSIREDTNRSHDVVLECAITRPCKNGCFTDASTKIKLRVEKIESRVDVRPQLDIQSKCSRTVCIWSCSAFTPPWTWPETLCRGVRSQCDYPRHFFVWCLESACSLKCFM